MMIKRRDVFRPVSVLLLVFVLAACGQAQITETTGPTENQTNNTNDSAQQTSNLTEIRLPPLDDIPKVDSKLSSQLIKLIETDNKEAGTVEVVIKSVPGQEEKTIQVLNKAGITPQSRFKNQFLAVVPISKLDDLAEEECISSIELPLRPTAE